MAAITGHIGGSNLHEVPWLSSIRALERKQDLTGLAPKPGLVAAQPIEGVGWQVGQANKRAREVVKLICRLDAGGCTRINSADGFVVFLLLIVFAAISSSNCARRHPDRRLG